MAEPVSPEHERLRLERDKLRFERQKFAAELRLKRREHALPRSTWLKEVLANPLALAIVGGFLTLMTGIATTFFSAQQSREAEALRASYAREGARDTLQADLIKKFVEGPSLSAVRTNFVSRELGSITCCEDVRPSTLVRGESRGYGHN